jgi:hypothetical protein
MLYGELVIFLMLAQNLQNSVRLYTDSSHKAILAARNKSALVNFHLNKTDFTAAYTDPG